MNAKEAISLFRFYQQSNHRKRTADSLAFQDIQDTPGSSKDNP